MLFFFSDCFIITEVAVLLTWFAELFSCFQNVVLFPVLIGHIHSCKIIVVFFIVLFIAIQSSIIIYIPFFEDFKFYSDNFQLLHSLLSLHIHTVSVLSLLTTLYFTVSFQLFKLNYRLITYWLFELLLL